MEKLFARNLLIGLLGFEGLGAIYGGGTLILDPSGGLLKMPMSMLEPSPFTNYLIPGIILFIILGIVPVMLIFALIKTPVSRLADRLNFFPDMHWAWSFSIYFGFALVIWLQLEMFFIRSVNGIHVFYMFLALLILFAALLPEVRKRYRKA
jgi:hypothetical protein